MPVMHKTRNAFPVNHHLGRHASQLEQIYFLPITLKHACSRVGQANKGQFVLFPLGLELLWAIRTHNHNLRVAGYKLIIVLAQLRHMRAAEWSHKAAVENKQYILPAAVISQTDHIAVEIGQLEIRCRCVNRYLWHDIILS